MGRPNFRPIAEPVYGVMRKALFLVKLDEWSQRPREDFSMLQPPVDALPGGDTDENGDLACTFYRLCRAKSLHEQQTVLFAELFHQQRWIDEKQNSALGDADPRGRPQRRTFYEIVPREQLVAQLQDWLEALHDRACEVRP